MPVAEMSHPTRQTTAGFWGKIPSRGDFVGIGLSPAFVAAWDRWVSHGIAASQEALGEDWLPAWMEAPVWCFSVGPNLFGPMSIKGLWMPSVDRAGRSFPLVIASTGGADADWLMAAETAGREALTEGLAPDELAARVPKPGEEVESMTGSEWWTDGAPRVASCRAAHEGLPEAGDFARMLDDAA